MRPTVSAAAAEEIGTTEEVGTTEEAGTAEEVGTAEEAGTADEVGTTEEAGTADEVGTTEEAGRADEVGTTEEAGTAEEADKAEATWLPFRLAHQALMTSIDQSAILSILLTSPPNFVSSFSSNHLPYARSLSSVFGGASAMGERDPPALLPSASPEFGISAAGAPLAGTAPTEGEGAPSWASTGSPRTTPIAAKPLEFLALGAATRCRLGASPAEALAAFFLPAMSRNC